MKAKMWLCVQIVGLLVSSSLRVEAARFGYPSEEFTARRQALCERLGAGTVLMFGGTMPALAQRFHQDNDFFYLTV